MTQNIEVPNLDKLIKAAKIIQKWRREIGSPISFETALQFICNACSCEIIIKKKDD